jgi:hypothetical protein
MGDTKSIEDGYVCPLEFVDEKVATVCHVPPLSKLAVITPGFAWKKKVPGSGLARSEPEAGGDDESF